MKINQKIKGAINRHVRSRVELWNPVVEVIHRGEIHNEIISSPEVWSVINGDLIFNSEGAEADVSWLTPLADVKEIEDVDGWIVLDLHITAGRGYDRELWGHIGIAPDGGKIRFWDVAPGCGNFEEIAL